MQVQAVVHLQYGVGIPQTSEARPHPTYSTTKHGEHLTSEAGDIQPPPHHTRQWGCAGLWFHTKATLLLLAAFLSPCL